MSQSSSQLYPIFACAIALMAISSCTPGLMRKSADNEVRRILTGKSSQVPNTGKGLLDVSTPNAIVLEEFRKNPKTEDFLGDRSHIEKGARVVPLDKALGLSVVHNRSYRTQKEALFLEALDLTLTRHDFAPIFSATGDTNYVNKRTPVSKTVTIPTGLQKQVTSLVSDATLTTNTDIGASLLMSTGAKLATNFTTDFLKLITGNLTHTSDSALAATLSQPLLRGAGFRATMETLTQAERDLLYSVRSFSQYRKTFAVDIATKYYNTLQARDAARNSFLAYTAFETALKSVQALNAEDRAKPSQVGLIQQASLRYRRQWISSIRSYEQQLDDLKIDLGIPIETPLLLEQNELEKLEIIDPNITLEEATNTALVTRLDLYNARNAVEDADRKIKVMEQNLLPQLDVVGGYQTKSNPRSPKVSLNLDRRQLSAGLALDLRLDKKADRNNYRESLLLQQRALRNLDLAEEQVRSQIRTDWRDVDVAKKLYDISQTGIAQAQRRLLYEQELTDLGQGTARDLIDAQQDLIGSKDALTSALVAHTVARLKLWRDMGVLFIKKDGSWIRVLKNEGDAKNDD
jgi:outer membrane protein TolC